MRRHAPATSRNSGPIAAVLADELPSSGVVVEVASGSGEHAVHFARTFPQLTWQPTDPDPAALASIAAWRADAGLPNLEAALVLDAADVHWPVPRADAIVCSNMAHISPRAATDGLFTAAGRLLSAGAPLILYGPFIEADRATAPSNVAFDADLKARNRQWGLRDLAWLDGLAVAASLIRPRRQSMPANNLTLVYRRC